MGFSETGDNKRQDASPAGRDYRWAAVRRIQHHRERLLLRYYSARATASARYWGVELGSSCDFYGPVLFRRTGRSRIRVSARCVFRSAYWSNGAGIDRPCMLSTLCQGAELLVGEACGLSGTVIAAADSVVLGSGVSCGANVTIMDTDWHCVDDPRAGAETAAHAPVRIEDGVWLGLGVVVLKGVTIGRGSVVAAGSIVTESLPAGVLAAGQPAEVVRTLRSAADRGSP